MENTEKNKRISIKLILFGILLFLVCVGITFFWYKIFQKDKVAVANLTIALKDNGEGVNITDLVPQSDAQAKALPAYSFAIENNGEIAGLYEVLLEDSLKKDEDGNSSISLLTREQLKYELLLNGKIIASGSLSEIKNNVLDTRVIDQKKTNNYELRIWVPLTAMNWEGKTYHYKVVVNTVVEEK